MGSGGGLKILSDICPCGACAVMAWTLDRNGIIWKFCETCHWWYIGND